jgi:hypothetical protein
MLARLEVVEEGARRDIGARADLLDLRPADPALLEQLDRGVEQRLAVAAAPLLEAVLEKRLDGGRAQGGLRVARSPPRYTYFAVECNIAS